MTRRKHNGNEVTTGAVVSAMIDYARLSFDAGLRNLELYQDQAEQATALALSNDDSLSEEARNATADMLLRARETIEAYRAVVEDCMSLLERELPLPAQAEARPENAA